MTKKEKKYLAQHLLMCQIASIGYGEKYEKFVKDIGSQTEADQILMEQMNRVAKILGYDHAWFS